MLKALPVAFAALLVIAGCVSVSPASSAPTAVASRAPTLGVTTPVPATPAATVAAIPTPAPTVAATPTPTATPTAVPTVQPTIAPTTEPTTLPSDEPSTEPSTEPGEPGTRDLLFDDDMSDATSGWQELNEDFATITYDTGVLAFRFNTDQSWASAPRALDDPNTTVFLAADFSPQSDGFFGSLCGDSTSNTYFGVVVGTGGGLIFVSIDNGTVNVLERHDDLALDVTVAASNPLALECNVDPTNGLSLIAGLANTGPVAVYQDAGGGFPLNFDVVALYAEAASEGYTLTVDTAAAAGVGGPFGTISTGAEILQQHIPDALQNFCHESPQFSDAAEFKVTCIEQLKGDGVEIAQYKQFADNDAMNAAYQDLVAAFGVDSTGSCESGPNEAEWTVNDQTGGRVQCAPQKVGIRFDWTDDLTSILSALIDLEGSYSDTYPQWQDAGPIIPQG